MCANQPRPDLTEPAARDLDALWADIQAIIAERFEEFPDDLDADACWPENSQPTEFLDLAQRLGVRLLYAHCERLTDEGADADPGLNPHRGKVGYTSLGWGHDGVRHGWSLEAPWHEASSDARNAESTYRRRWQHGDEGDDEQHQKQRITMPEAAVTALAGELALLPKYQQSCARLSPSRLAVVDRFLRDHDYPFDEHASLRYRLDREPAAIYADRYEPEQDLALGREAKTLQDSGMKKNAIQRRLNIGPARLNKVMGIAEQEAASKEPSQRDDWTPFRR